jgi:hypothetical protein
MCYSAQIRADYTRFVREYGAVLSIKDFFDLFWCRLSDPRIQVPRAVESAFASPQTDEAREIQSMIARHAATQVEDLRLQQAAQPRHLEEVERLPPAQPGGDEDALLQAAGRAGDCTHVRAPSRGTAYPRGPAQSIQPNRPSSNRAGCCRGIGPTGVGVMPSAI